MKSLTTEHLDVLFCRSQRFLSTTNQLSVKAANRVPPQSKEEGGSFMWENVNDLERVLMCWKKQLPYRTWLALTVEVLERSQVATLYLHHPGRA